MVKDKGLRRNIMGIYIEWMDGRAYAAATWDDLAKVVNEANRLEPDNSSEEWMDGVRYRVSEVFNTKIMYHDTESFFQELFRVGVLKDLRVKESLNEPTSSK
jgi:hypothetical protein